MYPHDNPSLGSPLFRWFFPYMIPYIPGERLSVEPKRAPFSLWSEILAVSFLFCISHSYPQSMTAHMLLTGKNGNLRDTYHPRFIVSFERHGNPPASLAFLTGFAMFILNYRWLDVRGGRMFFMCISPEFILSIFKNYRGQKKWRQGYGMIGMY